MAGRAHVNALEPIAGVAELAGDRYRSVRLAEALALVEGQRAQHAVDALARAPAFRAHRVSPEHAHAVLVEEPEQQILGREIGIGELAGCGRAHQDQRATPAVLQLLPRAQVFRAIPVGELLDQETAAAPRTLGAAFHRHLDAGRDLLGLTEIVMDALGERRALERDDALVALG